SFARDRHEAIESDPPVARRALCNHDQARQSMTKLTATIGGGKSTRVSPFALYSLVTGATTLRSVIEEAMRDAKRVVRRLRARRLERRRLQSTYNELRALDDHTLRDLGFH